MSNTTYLELVEGVGVEPDFHHRENGLAVPNPKAGDPAELREIGIRIPVPTMVGNEVINDARTVRIKPAPQIDPKDTLKSRIIPGTRVIETQAPAVVNALVSTGHYRVCDAPKSEQPRHPRRRKGAPQGAEASKEDTKTEATAEATTETGAEASKED